MLAEEIDRSRQFPLVRLERFAAEREEAEKRVDDQVGEDPGQEERGETQWDDVSRKENSNFY